MIGKDGQNLSVSEVTAENYACPKGEELHYHVKIENVLFDERTGDRKSHPRIQKFGRKAFISKILPALKKSGYTVEVLHNPDEWVKEHGDPFTKKARQPRQQQPIDLEKLKAELKAELREEVKAEMAAEPAGKQKKGKSGNDPVDPLES